MGTLILKWIRNCVGLWLARQVFSAGCETVPLAKCLLRVTGSGEDGFERILSTRRHRTLRKRRSASAGCVDEKGAQFYSTAGGWSPGG